MSKFKVGDKVEVVRLKNPENPFYGIGAKGKVVDDQLESPLVQFTKGPYQSTDDASWFVCAQDIELVKESKMKKSEGWGLIDKEGDSYAVTNGWAVEVDGEVNPGLIAPTRANARAIRNTVETYGSKATVRRVEIKVLNHKV